MNNLIGILLLATFVEGSITYVFGKTTQEMPPRPWLKYVSLMLGVALSVAYQVDLLAMAGMLSIFPFIGNIVSGIIIGRGSNYLNDFITLIKGTGDVAKIEAAETSPSEK